MPDTAVLKVFLIDLNLQGGLQGLNIILLFQ